MIYNGHTSPLLYIQPYLNGLYLTSTPINITTSSTQHSLVLEVSGGSYDGQGSLVHVSRVRADLGKTLMNRRRCAPRHEHVLPVNSRGVKAGRRREEGRQAMEEWEGGLDRDFQKIYESKSWKRDKSTSEGRRIVKGKGNVEMKD